MGLDQYAFSTKHKIYDTKKEIPDEHEVAYWRKHNRLQGWFENKYFEQAEGDWSKQDFNCQRFYLTEELLNELERDIKANALPKTQGFFFGNDSYTYPEQEEMKKYDLKFIEDARKEMASGKYVFYTCWW